MAERDTLHQMRDVLQTIVDVESDIWLTEDSLDYLHDMGFSLEKWVDEARAVLRLTEQLDTDSDHYGYANELARDAATEMEGR
jgi:hypothetical protein